MGLQQKNLVILTQKEQKKMIWNVILRRMMETFKEEIKYPLKEMEEKTNKNLEEINKSLKENQSNSWSQQFKTEIEQ